MTANFVGNLGTKKLHSIAHADGRCKLERIKEENKISFITLEEGLNYPSVDRRIFAPCNICITKYRETITNKKK